LGIYADEPLPAPAQEVFATMIYGRIDRPAGMDGADRRGVAPAAGAGVIRRLPALGFLLIVLIGCTPGAPPAEEASGAADPVLESREVLGDPMLALAEATIALSDGLDEARFKAARGQAMQTAVEALAQRREAVAAAQRQAAAAAEDAPVADAAGIVAEASAAAADMLPVADEELRFLQRIGALDTTLVDAAATWDEPGSQSEIRERLLRLADRVGGLRRRARRVAPKPRACTAMVENRLEWIGTVRSRTLELQAQANSAGGSTFDDLRESYRALPFAVEPRTADRADRSCWLQRSKVVATAAVMRTAVDELRESLSR
jgi:hypothetical protein